jgi:hypothetical protein
MRATDRDEIGSNRARVAQTEEGEGELERGDGVELGLEKVAACGEEVTSVPLP